MDNLIGETTTFLPQWSDPVSVPIDILTPPEILESQLLSFSLVSSGGQFDVSTSVNLTWEEPERSEELERYEVWVGSRALAEFEEPDNFGQLFVFPVNLQHPFCSASL